MALELWLAYLALCVLLAATPGPAVLLTVAQSISRGFMAGLSVILGTQLGNLFYFAISAAGLGAILMASENAFAVLKYAGAAYLIGLGIRTILRAPRAARPPPAGGTPLWRHPFTQGLVNQLANPKSVLFWGAVFPQFVDFTAAMVWRQFVILAASGIATDIVILSLYAATAARGGHWLASGPRAVWRERLSGATLVAVGGVLSLVHHQA